jgi:hypothetical protein
VGGRELAAHVHVRRRSRRSSGLSGLSLTRPPWRRCSTPRIPARC